MNNLLEVADLSATSFFAACSKKEGSCLPALPAKKLSKKGFFSLLILGKMRIISIYHKQEVRYGRKHPQTMATGAAKEEGSYLEAYAS